MKAPHFPTLSLVGFAIRKMEAAIFSRGEEHSTVMVRIYVEGDATGAVVGGPIDVVRHAHFSNEQLKSPELVREAIRSTLLRTVEHEIDEWLRIDGVRFDPHLDEDGVAP